MLPRKGPACAIAGEAADGTQTLNLVTHHQPDLLLLDYKMPGLGRLSTFCKEIGQRSPATRILILSGYGEEEVALEAAIGGAQGYILKGALIADLLSAIATIHRGGTWVDPHLSPQAFRAFLSHKGERTDNLRELSRRELKVLSLVAQGMNNTEISVHLHISKKTVKNHLTHIFAKLEVADRQQATLYFLTDKNSVR
jgi:DNA-binding NarL/FixJ family response regulator